MHTRPLLIGLVLLVTACSQSNVTEEPVVMPRVQVQMAPVSENVDEPLRFGSNDRTQELAELFPSRFEGLLPASVSDENSSNSFYNRANENVNQSQTSSKSHTSSARSTSSRRFVPLSTTSAAGCPESFLQSLGLQGQCGTGWIFPGLVGGECPVSACIIDVERPQVANFGPM